MTRAVVVPRGTEDAPKGGERRAPLHLETVMENVRRSLRLDDPSVASTGMTWGTGVFLGDPVRWALRHDQGSFTEEAAGPDLSYVSTHCAGADEVWETDHTGYTQVVQLDDHEASLLAAWARTGWWANPAAVTDVELSLARTDDADAGFDASEECEVTVRVRAGGLIVASMFVDTEHVAPAAHAHEGMRRRRDVVLYRLEKRRAGRRERRPPFEGRGRPYPALTTLKGAAGGTQTFRVDGARRQLGCRAGILPQTRVTPRRREGESNPELEVNGGFDNGGGVRFDSRKQPEANIEPAKSSHVLVRPLIDGVDVGPFILGHRRERLGHLGRGGGAAEPSKFRRGLGQRRRREGAL